LASLGVTGTSGGSVDLAAEATARSASDVSVASAAAAALSSEAATRLGVDNAIIASGAEPANVALAPVLATGGSDIRTVAAHLARVDVDGGPIPVLATGGTALRTVADRFGDTINVLDYVGVDPTGATDSSGAIQDAIDDGLALGARVVFPAGDYRIDSTLIINTQTLGSPLELYGAGGPTLTEAATKIVWGGASGGTMLTGCGNGIAIRNMAFMGSHTALACIDITESPSTGSWYRLSNLYVHGFRGAGSFGIRVGIGPAQCSEALIDNCYIAGSDSSGSYGGEYGIKLGNSNAKNFVIDRCLIRDVRYGVAASGGDEGSVSLYDVGFLGIFNAPNEWTASGATYGAMVVTGANSLLMSNCWSEGDGPSRIIDGAANGTSQFVSTILGGYYLTGAPDPDDVILRVGTTLRCIGVAFLGEQDNDHIGNIVVAGYGSGTVSIEGCVFFGGQGNVPVTDGSGNSLSDPSSYDWYVNPRNSFQFLNNVGGYNGALQAMRNITSRIDSPSATMYASADVAAMQVAVNATTTGRLPAGRLSAGLTVLKVKYDHDKFKTATSNLSIVVLSTSKHRLRAVYVEVITPFRGGAITDVDMAVKDGSSDNEELIKLFDCYTAAVVKGGASADLGVKMAAAVQGGVLYLGASQDISLRFVSTTAALGTGAATNLTQGEANVYLLIDRLDFA
jgi:hypothetical protein